jgi:hypothetical protein
VLKALYMKPYDDLLVANSTRKVAVVGDAEVVRVVTLLVDNVLQQSSLMLENLGQPCTEVA